MTKVEPSESFRGTTNTFSTGSGSYVLVIPKKIIEELKLDPEKRKAHFRIYLNKLKKEIIYRFIGEEEK